MKIKRRGIHVDRAACAKGWDGRSVEGLRIRGQRRSAHTGPGTTLPSWILAWESREVRERFKISGGKVSLAFQEVSGCV